MHHTQGYRDDGSDENTKRFNQVYDLCERILKLAGSEKANLELAEMYYNGRSRMALNDSIEKAHEWLDKAAAMNTGSEMQARVANLKSCDWMNKKDYKKALEFANIAIAIRESFPKEEQDPFLVANLYNRCAGFLTHQEKYNEAEERVNQALEYAEKCRGTRDSQDRIITPTYDHQYFGFYDQQKAKLLTIKYEKEMKPELYDEAIKHFDRAIETFGHHAQDSQAYLQSATILKGYLLMTKRILSQKP